jgi:cathepsin L
MNIRKLFTVFFAIAYISAILLKQRYQGFHGRDRQMYLDWLNDYESLTLTSRANFEYRFQIFSENLKTIEDHNRLNSTYTFGLNQFSDLTKEEFLSIYSKSMQTSSKNITRNSRPSNFHWNTPKKFNWLDQPNIIPLPENQSYCGCSYAFASITAIQASFAIFKKNEESLKFSKQILIDCGRRLSYEMYGCNGGTAIAAFKFSKEFGLYSADDLPFEDRENECSLNFPQIGQLTDFKTIDSSVENFLAAIVNAPVVALVEISSIFQFYKGGVIKISAPCGFYKNHYTVAIGYDLEAETPHVLFQNSFGEKWGENGYFRYAIGLENSNGMCDFANEFSIQAIF